MSKRSIFASIKKQGTRLSRIASPQQLDVYLDAVKDNTEFPDFENFNTDSFPKEVQRLISYELCHPSFFKTPFEASKIKEALTPEIVAALTGSEQAQTFVLFAIKKQERLQDFLPLLTPEAIGYLSRYKVAGDLFRYLETVDEAGRTKTFASALKKIASFAESQTTLTRSAASWIPPVIEPKSQTFLTTPVMEGDASLVGRLAMNAEKNVKKPIKKPICKEQGLGNFHIPR